MSRTSSEEMIDLIKALIKAEISQLDQLVVCKIFECNTDGTYNVKVVPIDDGQPMIKNVKASASMDLKADDFVYAMSIKNQLNNLIIFAKIGVEMPKKFLDASGVQELITRALQQYVPTLPDGTVASTNYVNNKIEEVLNGSLPYISSGNMTIGELKKKYNFPKYFLYHRTYRVGMTIRSYLYLCHFDSRMRPLPRSYWITAVPVPAGTSQASYRMIYSPAIEDEVYLSDIFITENISSIDSIALTPSMDPDTYYVVYATEDADGHTFYEWVKLEDAIADINGNNNG